LQKELGACKKGVDEISIDVIQESYQILTHQ